LGYTEKLNQKIYNKEEAKKILNDLGYIDSNNDGLLEKTTTTGKGKKAVSTTAQLELTLVVPAVNELSQLAQNIKVNLESIGIKTNVTIVPLQDIYKDYLKERKYDAILFGEAYGLIPDLYLF
jgi:ABC-type transport system substrate-binding protein